MACQLDLRFAFCKVAFTPSLHNLSSHHHTQPSLHTLIFNPRLHTISSHLIFTTLSSYVHFTPIPCHPLCISFCSHLRHTHTHTAYPFHPFSNHTLSTTVSYTASAFTPSLYPFFSTLQLSHILCISFSSHDYSPHHSHLCSSPLTLRVTVPFLPLFFTLPFTPPLLSNFLQLHHLHAPRFAALATGRPHAP